MNKSSTKRNLESLIHIANRLEELCNEVTFVGGSIIGLLITDKAAPDVRFTIDIDCIINVITVADYYKLSEKLRLKGFKEMLHGDHPICRWKCDHIVIDVMPVEEAVLGFSNKWYKEAQENAISKKLNDYINIKIISAPYFLATKLEAFKARGNQDFLGSHDLEDIISLINGRAEIINDIATASDNLKEYLSTEFSALINNDRFIQALPGHLEYSVEYEDRKIIVEGRIKAIIGLGT
jgi:hypothetical protein